MTTSIIQALKNEEGKNAALAAKNAELEATVAALAEQGIKPEPKAPAATVATNTTTAGTPRKWQPEAKSQEQALREYNAIDENDYMARAAYRKRFARELGITAR